MLKLVLDTIMKYNMISKGDRLVLGVSGGPDSIAMLHALYHLKDKLGIELHVGHLNHCFRGQEAKDDAKFVADFAQELGIACTLAEFDVPAYIRETKLSPEEAARNIRYDFLKSLATKIGAHKVALAHNANDQAETVLFNFLRGAGTEGLGGIRPVRDNFYIRPLIEVWRQQIENYCDVNSLLTRIDKSNLETVYTRNRIRLELIPHLEKEFNPNIQQALVKTADIMRSEEQYLQDVTENLLIELSHIDRDRLIIDLVKFREQPIALKRRIIKKSFIRINNSKLEFKHIDDIIELCLCGQTGSKIDLPGEYRARKNYDQIIFEKSQSKEQLVFEYQLNVPGETIIQEVNFTIKAEIINDKFVELKGSGDWAYFDYDKIPPAIVVRNREDGDVISPIGMKGKKKLKDFLIDSKIPRDLRYTIPMIAFGKEIIWAVGLRTSEKWKVTENTSKILKLTIVKN